MQIIYDDKYVQVWEFVFRGLNIGKWCTGKHCDGIDVKNVKTVVSRRYHPSFKVISDSDEFLYFAGTIDILAFC